MIDGINKKHIFLALNTFINHPNANLSKRHNSQLRIYSEKLNEEEFDGWFCSIENKTGVEVAFLNNNNIFEPLKTEILKQNWNNGNIKNNKISLKNWGSKYSICTIIFNAILNINEKYKDIIDEYIQYGLKSNLPFEHFFQILLQNAIINYHKYPYTEIKWS